METTVGTTTLFCSENDYWLRHFPLRTYQSRLYIPKRFSALIIRKEDEHYVSVTAAYMQALMHGKAMQMLNRGELTRPYICH